MDLVRITAFMITSAGRLIAAATFVAVIARPTDGREPGSSISVPSTDSESHIAYHAFDGDPETRWASKQGGKGCIEIDFGRTLEVNQLAIVWENAYAAEYKIEIAGENKDWETLVHKKGGKGGTEKFGNLRGNGRYFRISCLEFGPHARWSIWELEFGDPPVQTAVAEAAQSISPDYTSRQIRKRLASHGVKEVVFAARGDGNDSHHWYANFGYWSYDENQPLYGKGGRLCKLDLENNRMEILIDDPEGTIRDPVVHYDAGKILFSWRKAGTRVFHLYECDMRGENIRQITDGPYDDIEPCYLPDGGIVFVSGRGRRWVNCWLTQVGIIYRCDGDGGNIRQLSANIEHDNTPWVLPNGQIIYTRWEYVDRSQVDYHHLWTMNPDGKGQTVYFGNMHPRDLYIDAKPIPGAGEVVFINSRGHGAREHSGKVAVVSPKQGPDEKSALRNLSNRDDFRDPWPLSRDLFLVASGRKLLALDAEGNTAEIFTLPDTMQSVNLQEPRPVIEREREMVVPGVNELPGRNGRLILDDIYVGRNMQGVERGDIRKLLILETLPKPINYTGGMDPVSYGGSFTLERVVGTVPVEEDGSAYMELPPNRAFFFVALDENDNSIKRMQSFTSVMPGEVTGCVGCHERRVTTPFIRGPRVPRALERPPSKPRPIAGVPEVFDFPRDIQPILDRHCVECHNYEKYAGGVALTGDRGPMFSHSYISLTIEEQFADGRNKAASNYPPRALGASGSPLMDKISGGHHDVKVSGHEEDMIRYWIESAACYPGTYAALGGGAIGGYQQNRQIHTDDNWPTAGPYREAVRNRCINCHKQTLKLPLPVSMSDEIGISFWRFSTTDPRHRFSRHRVFNLTRPGKSLVLLAPLAKKAGGLGICRTSARDDAACAMVFESTGDPAYRDILSHIAAGKACIENELTRFDMPDFRPRGEYFREMKRFGILPESFDPNKDEYDVYELDRKYWRSLWYDSSQGAD